MWKLISFLLISLCCFISCHKPHHDAYSPPPAPQDTLTAGWKKISPSPGLEDVFFFNNTGFAISPTNFSKSTDYGNTWTLITTPFTNLVNLGMGSDTNAIAVNFPNKLICTHNGGSSFDVVTVNDSSLTDVFFVSTTKAYAAGKCVWKTTDGGHNWAKLYEFPNSSTWSTFYFLDEQNGWLIRNDGLYKTINAGLTWQSVNVGSGYNFPKVSGLFFVNANHGLFADDKKVASTSDGGLTWNMVYSGQTPYHDIYFLSDSIGYITDRDQILKSTDGGITWTRVVKIGSGIFFELHFTDPNHGWACGGSDVFFKYEQ
jgi:photosystem II stability/assembly factor-like uncharacterized protein